MTKNWCFWIVVLEKTLESPLDCKEIQPVHPKGNQSWIFIGRTDAETETPILWSPDAKNWLIWKDPDAGNDWRWEEKGTTKDGWMASLTQWTWVWVGSGSWWWTGKPGMLKFMVLQRVGHDWVTELNWTECIYVNPNHSIHPTSPSPLGNHMLVCSLHLYLCFCSANKFICIIFLDSTYNWYTIFAFLFLSSLCVTFMSLQMAQFHSFLWLSGNLTLNSIK